MGGLLLHRHLFRILSSLYHWGRWNSDHICDIMGLLCLYGDALLDEEFSRSIFQDHGRNIQRFHSQVPVGITGWLDGIHPVKKTHEIPLLDVGPMSPAPNFLKYEKVHLLYAIWNNIGEYPLQGWLVSRSSQNCCHTRYGGSHFYQRVSRHLGSYRILSTLHSSYVNIVAPLEKLSCKYVK